MKVKAEATAERVSTAKNYQAKGKKKLYLLVPTWHGFGRLAPDRVEQQSSYLQHLPTYENFIMQTYVMHHVEVKPTITVPIEGDV